MPPLNPNLYAAIQAAVGTPRISNEGEPMSAHYVPDHSSSTPRLQMHILSYGESYRICCPFCGDTTYRLWINHRWAEYDERTGHWNLYLAKCFNEETCIAHPENRQRLHALVYPNGYWSDRVEAPVAVPVVARIGESRVITLPTSKPLAELPENHPARKYLISRGFDPNRLARDHGLRYCDECDDSRPRLSVPRIIIPMYMPARALRGVHKSSDDLQLVGWQARMLESNHGAAPKYLTSTGTQKSRLLYNFPNARKASGPAIIVEGVTDVWKIGRSAVALLGKSMSPEQLRWIGTWFALRAVIVWLDRDAEPEAKLIQSAIIQARKGSISRGGVYLARCPKGKKDPGECSASEIEAVLKKVNQLEKSRRLRVT